MLRHALGLLVVAALITVNERADACCPAPRSGQEVVNADQTVILVWDAANKTQHFIRRAAFQGEAEDFGFLVPTPSQPELAESGDEAFPFLQKLTEPEHIKASRPTGGSGGGCCGFAASDAKSASEYAPPPQVAVLDEKMVAGFHAVVLEAKSSKALVGWLEEHHYAFSPQIEAWAKPYVDGGWKITALQIAKSKEGKAGGDGNRVVAGSLRMSFKTEIPLFPYREPDYGLASPGNTRSRLLRIYFIGEARYVGVLEKDRIEPDGPREVWEGRTAWAGKLKPEDRERALRYLGLPETTLPITWWLTEIEDYWPYRLMPGDVYFLPDRVQNEERRPPVVEYVMNDDEQRKGTDTGTLALMALALPPIAWQLRRRRNRSAGHLHDV